jgi:hypothetical protein
LLRPGVTPTPALVVTMGQGRKMESGARSQPSAPKLTTSLASGSRHNVNLSSQQYVYAVTLFCRQSLLLAPTVRDAQQCAQPASGLADVTKNLVTNRYAIIADIDVRPGDNCPHLMLTFVAERAVNQRLWQLWHLASSVATPRLPHEFREPHEFCEPHERVCRPAAPVSRSPLRLRASCLGLPSRLCSLL